MKEKEKRINNKRKIEGIVIGNNMDKAVKVRVDIVESHPVYKKTVKRKKVYFAHTEKDLSIGDKVKIQESRPLSKKIRWVVIDQE